MPHGLPPDFAFSQSGEVSDLEWLLLEVQRIDGCEATKAQVLRLLKAQAGKVIRFSHRILTRPDQVRWARQLLDAGEPTPVVRDRLRARYGCCSVTAYTLIQKAIDQRGAERAQELRRAQLYLL